MTDFDTDAWQQQVQAEARAQVIRDRADHQLAVLAKRRPAAFSQPGELRRDIHPWITAYMAGRPGSLVLFGDVGTGKTWAAWKTIEALISRGWTGRYDFATAYQLKAAASIPVNRDQLRTWAEADLLVLDDVGSIRINDWDADSLFSLIDQRWQHQLPVIVTSNEMNLRGLLGDRAASRLADGATAVEFKGDDLRRTVR